MRNKHNDEELELSSSTTLSVSLWPWFEPSHEIMVLFVLPKLILQSRMRSHPVELDVWFLVRPFVYFHISCVRTVKALVRLRKCAGSPEPSLVAYVISTIISWAGSFTVRPVLVTTSIKQATCIHRPVFQFPIMAYKNKFTCIKQALVLSKHFSVIPLVLA